VGRPPEPELWKDVAVDLSSQGAVTGNCAQHAREETGNKT